MRSRFARIEFTSDADRGIGDEGECERHREQVPWASRRRFFRRLLLAGSGWVLTPNDAMAGPSRSKSSARYRWTHRVREATRALRIRSGRWKWIIAHHSAVPQGNAMIYDRAHRQRGMENGLAYHFVIGNGVDSEDGEIEVGRRWLGQMAGGHVRQSDLNEVAIGICLVGNFQQTSPTPRQLLAFRELMDFLRSDVVGSKVRFAVHREIDPGRTVCPGRLFPTEQMHRRYGTLRRT
ncbi:MAG: peptidoglycan recognition protein family protein [Nitrospira sp.]|nr:peptidoglycan recognition protein family protein [Nitrospira sp.]